MYQTRGRRRKNNKALMYAIFIFVLIIIIIISVILIAKNSPSDDSSEKVSNNTEKTEESELYYYEADKENRYKAYQELHPELEWEDVVWRVNVQLDKAPYEDPVLITDVNAIPVLVNKYYHFPEDFVPENLVETKYGVKLKQEAYDAYLRMEDAVKKDGLNFSITSAYRTIEYQKNLYDRYLKEEGNDPAKVDVYSSRPGFSEHHTGHTVDLLAPNLPMNRFGESKESDWVIENAHKYGFIVRYTEENADITNYKPEPWHLTYVGEEAAQIIKDNNIQSLEEYVVKYVMHKENA